MNNILTVTKVYELDIYAEIHCDLCNNIIHNHIDCPICLKSNASTNAYFDLHEDESFILECEECESRFKLVGDSWYSDSRVVKLEQNT
jgi:hypothetical protein